jgi:hypothetical protein
MSQTSTGATSARTSAPRGETPTATASSRPPERYSRRTAGSAGSRSTRPTAFRATRCLSGGAMSSTACDVAAAVDDMSSTPVGPAQRRAPGTGQAQSRQPRRALLGRPHPRFADRSGSGPGLCPWREQRRELALELRSKLLRKLHCGFDLDTSDRHALNIDSEGHAEGAAI